ncbi:YfaP family protein [Archangium lansingense]|uniref:Lipoprotein n=1 Tax=Archangium lansingense TaxID=2995310 RepID=A0ABT3ZU31_9BACT|nr:hypothetical protein [Archangium lansinium]MCY1072897.1 hypothetical protein [Archangium lansinium]
MTIRNGVVRTACQVMALTVLLGLGGACSEAETDEPVTDLGLTNAAAAVLSAPDNPDVALQAYQGEIARVLEQSSNPEEISSMLHLSPLAKLDAQTSGAFAALEQTVDGRVYSTAFVASRAKDGVMGLSTPLCTENVDQARTVVYFVNGIGNSIFHALASLHVLEKNTKSLFEGSVEYRLFYNASGSRSPEAECSYYGLVLNDPRVTSSMRAQIEAAAAQRCNDERLRAKFEDFAEAIVQWLDPELSRPEPLLVGRLQELVLSDVLSGKKVLLVAHSQGNFYVNAALSAMPSNPPDGEGTPADSVGVVAVASPLQYLATQSTFQVRHVQLFGDIIHAVPGAPDSTVENENSQEVRRRLQQAGLTARFISALGAKGWVKAVATIALYLPVVHAAYVTHNFTESYLQYPASLLKVQSELQDVNSRLGNSRDTLGQGFFQVTLTWNIAGDIDLHLVEPNLSHVYFFDKYGDVGVLDRDDIQGRGPENYFVCSPGKLVPGTYSVMLNNYSGTAGTDATVRIRAGSQFRTYMQVMDGPSYGANLIELVKVKYGIDGSFSFSR